MSYLYQSKDMKETEVVEPPSASFLPGQEMFKQCAAHRGSPRYAAGQQEAGADMTSVFRQRESIAPLTVEFSTISPQHHETEGLVGVPWVGGSKRPACSTCIPAFLMQETVDESGKKSPIRVEDGDGTPFAKHPMRLTEECFDVRKVVPRVLENECIKRLILKWQECRTSAKVEVLGGRYIGMPPTMPRELCKT